MSRLREAIDRMVEDAIRRILPSVMNEVLVATIARAGTAPIVAESAPRRRPPKRRRQPVREQKAAPRRSKGSPRERPDLSDLLDESVGAEFYQDPRAVYSDGPSPADVPPVSSRIQALPPDLRALAEDVGTDDEGGEMWQPGEYDSAPIVASGPEIRNVSVAAKAVGVDFDRMRSVIGKTAARKLSPEDRQAQIQFEENRLKRKREQLNDGKPVE